MMDSAEYARKMQRKRNREWFKRRWDTDPEFRQRVNERSKRNYYKRQEAKKGK